MAIMDLKWVGWIPRVSIPNPYQSTLAIFLIHHYFRTEMESLKSPRILIQRCFKKLGAEPFLVLERKRKLQLNRCQVSYISQKYISTPKSQKYVSNPKMFGMNIRIELKMLKPDQEKQVKTKMSHSYDVQTCDEIENYGIE